MNHLFIFFVWIPFIICLFLAWYFSHRAGHIERKMLIEKGLSLEDLLKSERGFRFPWLKLGIVIIGLSVGFIIIAVLATYDLTGKSDAIYPAIFGLCGGGSLLVAHFIDKRSKPD